MCVHMKSFHLSKLESRKNQVRSHLEGLAHFSYINTLPGQLTSIWTAPNTQSNLFNTFFESKIIVWNSMFTRSNWFEGNLNQNTFKKSTRSVIRPSSTFLLYENFLSSSEWNVRRLFIYLFTSFSNGKYSCEQRRI